MKLALLGVNHNTAPIEVRERLAIPTGQLADATRSLLHQPGVRESMILSTCNRVELVTLHEDTADLRRFLAEYFSVPTQDIEPHLYEYSEREAVRHLFRVASSLDSMVVGEPQILGQVKESYTVAREIGAVQATLEPLLQRAFTVARKVRRETQIGSSSVSIASVAVDLAQKIFGSLKGKTVLLVGAGKMSELAARHLIAQGAGNLFVANRTRSRAERIAQEFHGAVMDFESLAAQAHQADIVVTSTGSQDAVFTVKMGRDLLSRRRGRPMFFIDIAVPRDVEPAMNQVDGAFVYDIDDLQQVAAANMAERSKEAQAAERIVAREVDRYEQRLQTLDAVPAIRAMQMSAEAMREAELRRIQSKLTGLTPEQQQAVEALTRGLMNKFLHGPMAGVREAAREGDAEALDALRRAFGPNEEGDSK
ncbi:glutamyl-tRNA reductase [Terriglobus tenax]|uniref:glutamyl-tRNA reductase n=1 Tax=Terriglobus tenax TaxID=1111115 RepID=UPI0021E0A949|nr:glutamyl-tRNA reductase [Terriglobus tenax]